MERGDDRMKKLIALMVVAAMLVGCGNFVADFGMPTVSIAPRESRVVSEVVGGTTVTKLVLEYTARSLPGSPGGVITHFNLVGGGTIPGAGEVLPCSPTAQIADCPVTTGILEITPPPPRGSIVLESYAAIGFNGHGRTVPFNPPIPLY
jgi:hypothetical protein